ncbi:hypothetical protein BGZ92_006386 [Podila epicladia]|nr:hypothetical protein BGZ92_006386 [Podila epicladia]
MHSSTSTEYPAQYLIPDHEVDSFLASFSASSLSSTLSPYPLDLFDHPNSQNLPSPYSPMKHAVHFDRSEEDDSVDGYEIFSTPTPTPDHTPQMSPIQHHQHQQQHHHHQQQQQQQQYQQFQFQQHLSPYQGIYNDRAPSQGHVSNKLVDRPASPHSVLGPLEPQQQQQLAQLHQQQILLQQQRQFQLDQNARMGMVFPSYPPQHPSMLPQHVPPMSPPISSTLSSPLLLSSFPQFPFSSPLLPLEEYGTSQLDQYLTTLEGHTHRPILENTIPQSE